MGNKLLAEDMQAVDIANGKEVPAPVDVDDDDEEEQGEDIPSLPT